jgi:hypothetical protein
VERTRGIRGAAALVPWKLPGFQSSPLLVRLWTFRGAAQPVERHGIVAAITLTLILAVTALDVVFENQFGEENCHVA